METVMSRIGRLLGMRMHNPTRPVCPVPQSTEAVPSNTDTAPVEQPVISKKKKSRKHNVLLKPNYMKLSDSIDTVVKLRSEGLTYRLIGEHLKMSKQRVYQIIQAGRQRDLDRSKWTFGLSVRNAKLMDRLEFKCKEDARKGFYPGGSLRSSGPTSVASPTTTYASGSMSNHLNHFPIGNVLTADSKHDRSSPIPTRRINQGGPSLLGADHPHYKGSYQAGSQTDPRRRGYPSHLRHSRRRSHRDDQDTGPPRRRSISRTHRREGQRNHSPQTKITCTSPQHTI